MLAGWIDADGRGMKQLTLAIAVFDRYAKTTRRAVFLAEMERVVPGSALCKLIEPFYSKPGNGRPAGRGRADAAHLFPAALVQSVRPGSGRGALRFAGDAAFCWHRPWLRAGAGRDDGVSVPPSARGA